MNSAIVLDQVSKRLGNREILHEVSFSVERGDIFGFLGPNGAGKTTTIRVILGLMPPSAGTTLVLGQDVKRANTRRKLGFLLEADGLYDNATAYNNLNYYAQIYSIRNPEHTIATVLDSVGLSDRAKDKVSSYSKGMRQRLTFARALLHDPELLVLDEPTSGVDPTGQIEMRELVLDEVRKRGKTVFLSSHNLDEVQRICNRIALIDKGRIKLYGDREKLQKQAGKGVVTVETAEAIPEQALNALKNLPKVTVEKPSEKMLKLSLSNGTAVSDIVSCLSSLGVKIEQVQRAQASLEEIYASILKEG